MDRSDPRAAATIAGAVAKAGDLTRARVKDPDRLCLQLPGRSRDGRSVAGIARLSRLGAVRNPRLRDSARGWSSRLERRNPRCAATFEHARKTVPLFDIRSYTAALERAYLEMIPQAHDNLPPADITISP